MKIQHIEADPEGFDRLIDKKGRYLGSFTKLNEEFVEIKNDEGVKKDTGKWSIEDLKGHKFIFPLKTTIQSRKIITLYTGSGSNTSSEFYWKYKMPVWNNYGDTAILKDADGRVVDKFTLQPEDIAVEKWTVPETEGYNTSYTIQIRFKNNVAFGNFNSIVYTKAVGSDKWEKEDSQDEPHRVTGYWYETYNIKGKKWNWYTKDVTGVHVVRPEQKYEYKVEYRRDYGKYYTVYSSEQTAVRITQEMWDRAWWASGGTIMIEIGGTLFTIGAAMVAYSWIATAAAPWVALAGGVLIGIGTLIGVIGGIIDHFNPLD